MTTPMTTAPLPTPRGGWLLSYHQDGTDPGDRDRQVTDHMTGDTGGAHQPAHGDGAFQRPGWPMCLVGDWRNDSN